MKLEQIKCPNCGGNIVLKDNDVWVCSSCRSIYKEEKDTSVDDKIKLDAAKQGRINDYIAAGFGVFILIGCFILGVIMIISK